MSGGMITSVSEYQVQKVILGGELEIIGYPTSNGSGTAAMLLGSQIAINVESEHKEEAWQFVKTYIRHGYSGIGFPMVNSILEEVLQETMTPEDALGEDGITKCELPKGGLYTEDADIIVYAAT